MNKKSLRSLGLLVLLIATLLTTPLVLAKETERPLQQEAGTNLLANPGFEGIGRPETNGTPNYNNWTRDTFNGVQYGEIFTPEGWVTWWQEGEFKRPECKVIPNEAPFNEDPKRVHQGYYSGMCFTFFGKQNAGYYQVVRNVPAGAQLEASFYAHAWSCGEDSPPRSCGDPHSFYFQVGVDTNGGTDPFSSSITWSDPYYRYDTYGIVGPMQVTAGEGGVVTFFMKAYGKWPNKHNDAYWDNASLKLVTPGEPPTSTPAPPPPTSDAPPPTPRNTPTPRPDGAVVHVIAEGDTLFGLAFEYGVTIDQIYELNNLGPQDILSIGQEIVISTESGTAPVQPTATPEPEQETTPETTDPAQPTEAPTDPDGAGNEGGLPSSPQNDTASLCVLAYYDANGDMFRQADSNEEMLLPNAEISLVGTSGPVGTRTTDGISEPYCFENLEPGNYVLRHTPPPGYKLTDAGQWNIPLSANQVSSLQLGYTRDEGASQNPDAPIQNPGDDVEPTDEPNTEEEGSRVNKVVNTILRVSGVIMVLLAIAVAVLFFLSRRPV